MAKLSSLARLAFLVAYLPFPACAGTKPQSTPVSLTLSVFNDAAIPRNVLFKAQDRATFILQKAGISLTWLNCGAPLDSLPNLACREISFPDHLSLRLVSTPSHKTEDTFGRSHLDDSDQGSYAYVYVGVLNSSSVTGIVDIGDLIGTVAAHEIGHLLLGRDSHSTQGLMSANWRSVELQQAAKGILLFDQGQANRIRLHCLSANARGGQLAPFSRAAAGN